MIFIVGEAFGFPHGYGATSRVFAFAKGFLDNGAAVKVLCLKPSEFFPEAVVNRETEGIVDGVPFKYLSGSTKRYENFFTRRYTEARSIFRLLKELRSERGRHTVLIYSDTFYWFFFILLAVKCAGSFAAVNVCEYPFLYRKRNTLLPVKRPLYFLLWRKVDLFLTITRYLSTFVIEKRIPSSRVLMVPILIVRDPRFDIKRTGELRRLLYIGDLQRYDEVDFIIELYLRAKGLNPAIELGLAGGNLDHERLAGKYPDGQLAGVTFHGQVTKARIKEVLLENSILLLPRKKAVFSDAGFPTKLGEYLESGNPVLVSGTGDIPDYLQDGTNAFIPSEYSVQAFLEKLQFIISNPGLAFAIGERGREVALSCFDARVHSKHILNIISADARTV
jgi:glycosyltransferase involved in cell wall biosynthesis